MTEVGAVFKKYRGFLNEAFSSADAFVLKSNCQKTHFRTNKVFSSLVPMDLDVKMKAVTLGALFLIVNFLFQISTLKSMFSFFRNICFFHLFQAMTNSSLII